MADLVHEVQPDKLSSATHGLHTARAELRLQSSDARVVKLNTRGRPTLLLRVSPCLGRGTHDREHGG